MMADVRMPRVFVAVLVTLIALAWMSLIVWGRSPYSRYLSHQHLDDATQGNQALLVIFVLGWMVMTIAMMLPTSMPLVVLFQRLTRRRADGIRLVGLLLLGYLTIWFAFGVLAHAGDVALHKAVDQSPWLQAHASFIGAAILLLAGIYQFTPLKYHCLDRCRSPLGFITARWHGYHEAVQALRLGLDHGVFCLGCCWSLMLLMFAVGTGTLGWMLALGAIMAIEKNVSWGKRISAPLGVVLVGWGLMVALTGTSTFA